MTEQQPVYYTAQEAAPPPQESNQPLPDMLRAYFEREREATIIRLRMLDRVLGRRQTIPERAR